MPSSKKKQPSKSTKAHAPAAATPPEVRAVVPVLRLNPVEEEQEEDDIIDVSERASAMPAPGIKISVPAVLVATPPIASEPPSVLSHPSHCVVDGLQREYYMRDFANGPNTPPATFTITAYNRRGERRDVGGETFGVAIRGAGKPRTRLIDNRDGTYEVKWKVRAHA